MGLAVKSLDVGYRSGHHTTTVLSGVTGSVEAGQMVGLVGPNGAGKSTLLRSVAGLQPSLRGEVELNGTATSRMSRRQIAQTLSAVLTDRVSVARLTCISSGASLGVALVVLSTSTSMGAAAFASGLGIGSDLLIMVAAALGATVVLCIVMLTGRFIHSSTILLLLGVMIGYFVSSGVTVLLSRASPELVAQYTRWQFGSYHGVTWDNIKVMVPIMVIMIGTSLPLAKPLNALLLGERYAQTMGMNLKVVRSCWSPARPSLPGRPPLSAGRSAFLELRYLT